MNRREQKAVSLYSSGKTFHQIAKELGMGTRTLHIILGESGVKIRARGMKDRVGIYRGAKSWNWKGGVTRAGGRVRIYKPHHAHASKQGYVFRYILVWEKHHKKKLPKGYDIHHRNEIKDDDRPNNLRALTRSQHRSYHMKAHWKKFKESL